jgi:hypothetical protein
MAVNGEWGMAAEEYDDREINGGGEWLKEGQGRRPRLSWSLSTEAPLVALQLARETGEVLAADAIGGLYHIDRSGKIANLTRGPSPIRALAWSDTGSGGIALVGDEKLYWFNRRLLFQGWLEHSEPVVGLALEAHGTYAAVSLSSATNVIYDANRKRVRRFVSQRPLIALEFLVSRAALVGVAEYGLLCAYSFSGQEEWQQQLWSNVGDLSLTGDGRTILLACFSHGIQCHDGAGRQVGSYQVGGTVSRVSTSIIAGRIAAATIERHFYYMAADGQVVFQATLPDDVCRVVCEPIGKGVVLGLTSGRILRLDWGAIG